MDLEPATEGELTILEVIWKQGGATSRELAAATYAKVSDSKLASVQKLVERLEAKGFVRRDRSDRAHRFTALVGRDDYLRHRLQGLADRLCDGALVPLVTTLLRSQEGFSPQQGAELRQLIDEIWPATE